MDDGDDDFLAAFYEEDGDEFTPKPDKAADVHAAIMSRASSFVTLEKQNSVIVNEKEKETV